MTRDRFGRFAQPSILCALQQLMLSGVALRALLLPGLLLPGLVGCVGSHWQRTQIVADSSALVVEVVRRVDQGRVMDLGYSHPADIDGRYLEACFGETRFRVPKFFKEREAQPVVAPELARLLGDAVALGLRKANGSQRVRFRVFNPEQSLLFLPGTTVTQGVVFVQPAGTLNIAFEHVGSVPDPEDPDPAPSWGDPTRWASLSVRLIPPRGARFFRDRDGGERKLWLTFANDGVLPTAADTGGADSASPTKVDPEEAEPPVVKPTVVKPPVAKPPITEPPRSRETTPPEKSNTQTKLSDAEILQRLRFLEELYEEGTLSEEDYRKKRQELLNRGTSRPDGS